MFNPFASLIAEFNSTLPTLTDGDATTLQTDSSGRLVVGVSGNTLSIDDGGGAITVDGTVTADTELETDDLDTGAGTDTQAIVGLALAESGGHALVGSANPMPISDNGGSLTVDNAGTFAVQEDGAALTALQLIDDVVFSVDDAAGAADAGNNVLAVRDDVLATLTPVDGDYVSLRVSSVGALWTEDVNSDDMLTALQLIDDAVQVGDAVWTLGDSGMAMMAVRDDALTTLSEADGDYTNLRVDSTGALHVTGTFNAAVDDVFESGTEADSASDDAGDGIVAINDSTMTTIASVAVGDGTTAYITGLDASADIQARWELIVDDAGTPSEWVRAFAMDGVTSHNKNFPRAIEITGATNRSVILRAQGIGVSGNAAGAINAYTR